MTVACGKYKNKCIALHVFIWCALDGQQSTGTLWSNHVIWRQIFTDVFNSVNDCTFVCCCQSGLQLYLLIHVNNWFILCLQGPDAPGPALWFNVDVSSTWTKHYLWSYFFLSLRTLDVVVTRSLLSTLIDFFPLGLVCEQVPMDRLGFPGRRMKYGVVSVKHLLQASGKPIGQFICLSVWMFVCQCNVSQCNVCLWVWWLLPCVTIIHAGFGNVELFICGRQAAQAAAHHQEQCSHHDRHESKQVTT